MERHMKDRKIIGTGNTAKVYEWEANKVIKLFNEGYPEEFVDKEFQNAKIISNMDFEKPKVYEILHYENQIGIVYDRIQGESLQDWVMRTSDAQGCASYMSKMHKDILRHKVRNVPSYKKFLEKNLLKTTSNNSKETKEALNLLDKLHDGDTLCHGDFHPGNIFIVDGKITVIDFMNICQGSFLYDIARTVFLVEYTPVPMELKDREMILQFKKKITELYLKEMNVTREMIKDYLIVISAARKGECPNEDIIKINYESY
jgi:thiamine kinase-like enzyme